MMGPKHGWMNKAWDANGLTAPQLQELGVSSRQEVQALRDARIAARRALSEYLARPDVSGLEKQHARCAYIHQHGRLACQCRGCWLLPGNCVCAQLRRARPATRVIIHLHQDEWGRGSNTGCLCAGSLEGAHLLLRGHAPHDEQFEALLSDPGYTTALLWPGEDALDPQQLQELAAARSNGRIALVAVDATWSCAVKMRKKYPEGMLTVRLPPDLALPQLQHIPAAGVAADTQQAHSSVPLQAGPPGSSSSSSSNGGIQQQQQPEPNGSKQLGGSEQPAGAAAAAPDVSAPGPGLGSSSPQPSSRVSKGEGPKHVPAPGERVSLFRGVRKYHGKASENGRVSTLEAVAAALLALEGDEGMYAGLLHNLMLKVDAMRQQKHMPLVYGIAGGGGSAGGSEGEEEEDGV